VLEIRRPRASKDCREFPPSKFPLEKCLLVGGSFIAIGAGTAIYALFYWYDLSFGKVEGESLIKIVCAASFMFGVGFQLVFASFLVYLLDQK
jgi:hypothetical protein